MTCRVLDVTLECRGLCWHSCGIVPMTAAEVARLQEASGLTFEVQPIPTWDRFAIVRRDGTCQALQDGRCAGYDGRPALCRVYGLTRALRCPHGCEPSRWLTDRECGEVLGLPLPDGMDLPSMAEVVRAREALR